MSNDYSVWNLSHGSSADDIGELLWHGRVMGHKSDIWVSAVSRHGQKLNPFEKEVVRRYKGTIVTTPNSREREYAMHEDDMSHMADVFLNGQLPYAEYLTESDYHPISKGGGKALADMRDKYGSSFMAKYSVPRPDGRVTHLSVISGMMFYSRRDAPYEIMVYENGKRDNEPIGYQTDEDLMILIAKLLGESDGIQK